MIWAWVSCIAVLIGAALNAITFAALVLSIGEASHSATPWETGATLAVMAAAAGTPVTELFARSVAEAIRGHGG